MVDPILGQTKEPPLLTSSTVDGAFPDATRGAVRDGIDKELQKDNKPRAIQRTLTLLERERAGLKVPDAEVKDLNDLYDGVKGLMGDIDRQVQAALHTVDEAHALAETLYRQASEVVKDPVRQAQIFDAVAQSLHDQGSVFDARRDNPPMLSAEQKIDMEYTDQVQGFALAPWNGVPVHLKGDGDADLSAAVAIPLIDVAGIRYSWSKSRFGDVRTALGFGYARTKDSASADSNATRAAALPNVSIGFANFKVGFGYLLGKDVGRMPSDRWRVIVGADLYKVITGSNVEAF